jgi:3-hydroxyacyl-CoA dehydrogenase
MQVTVWDPRAQAADFVRRYVADAWPAMARLGMTADASPDALRFCATAEEAVTDAEFVQENAPERLATKRELYARLDPVMPADTVLTSSTSGLIMSEMQAGLRRPRPSPGAWTSTVTSANGRSTSARRHPAIWRTGCRRRCGEKQSTRW